MAFLFDPLYQAGDASGLPLAGATLTFYVAGTTTKIDIWQDSGATTPRANPVTANSAGLFPPIFLTTEASYKFVLKDAAGATVQTVDNVESPVIGAQAITYTNLALPLRNFTRTDMGSISFPSNMTSVHVLGNESRSDGQSGVFVRVDSQPSGTTLNSVRSLDRFLPDGTTDSTDGGWWRRVYQAQEFMNLTEVL